MLVETASALVAGDKGLLAMDESHPTCNKRFARLGIAQTGEARRAYRELIVTAPGLGECISGAILFEGTIRRQKMDGTPFLRVLTDPGIIPGIKVDTGAKDMAGHSGEKISGGLIVSQIVLDAFHGLDMSYPGTTEKRRRELKSIRSGL